MWWYQKLFLKNKKYYFNKFLNKNTLKNNNYCIFKQANRSAMLYVNN